MNGNMLPGIDLIAHPDPDSGPGVDFAQMRKTQEFYFVVLRIGRAKMDYNAAGVPTLTFVKNNAYDGYITQLKKLGIPWVTVFGAYPWEWGNEQAEIYWQWIRDDLPVMPFVSLEKMGEWLPQMEGNRIDFYNVITGRLNALTGGRYKPGPEVGLYTNLSLLRKYLLPLPVEFSKSVYNFTAQWNDNDYPAVEGFNGWSLWQRGPGEVFFNGGAAEFEEWAHYKFPPVDPAPDPDPEPEPEPEPEQKSWWKRLIEWLIGLLQQIIDGGE